MKKYVASLLFLLVAICCSMPSCKRKENVETIQTRLLHTWKLSKIATDDNGNNGIDASEIHPVANGSVDKIVFNSDSTGLQTVVAANGVTTEYDFTWTLGKGDTITRNGIGNNVIKYHIANISSTSLELRNYSEQNILCAYYFDRN